MPETNNDQEKRYPLIFNIVHHDLRREMGLSIEEYCLLDTTHRLQRKSTGNDKYPDNQCCAGKAYFAKILDLNRATIQRMISKLVKRGFLIKKEALYNNVVPLVVTERWITSEDDAGQQEGKNNHYNKIFHIPRIELGLSCTEYCILDTFNKTSKDCCLLDNDRTRNRLMIATGTPPSTFYHLFSRLMAKGYIYQMARWDERWGEDYLAIIPDWKDLIINFSLDYITDGEKIRTQIMNLKQLLEKGIVPQIETPLID